MLLGTSQRLRLIAWAALTGIFILPAPLRAQDFAAVAGVPNAGPSGAEHALAGDGVRTRFLIGLEKSVVFPLLKSSAPLRK